MKMRVAATQIDIELGDVQTNMEVAERLVREAAEFGASVVVLPEFFTSGIALDDRFYEVPELNRQSKIMERLISLSHDNRIAITGSFLRQVQRDIFNSMVLVFPDGEVHIHNKDIPTQFENCYYTDGDTDRSHGRYGLALCWEMLRSKTIRELSASVQVVLAGSCWWGLPIGNSNPELDEYNRMLNEYTPGRFAAACGLPVVHASLKGIITGRRSMTDQSEVSRPLLGTTQIVGSDGTIINRIDHDASGVIVSDIELPGRIQPHASDSFWLTPLRSEFLSAWDTQNRLGREAYQARLDSE